MHSASMHADEKAKITVTHRVHEADDTEPMFGVLRIERAVRYTTTGDFAMFVRDDPDFLRDIARHALALRFKLVARRKSAPHELAADIVADELADHRVALGFEDDALATAAEDEMGRVLDDMEKHRLQAEGRLRRKPVDAPAGEPLPDADVPHMGDTDPF